MICPEENSTPLGAILTALSSLTSHPHRTPVLVYRLALELFTTAHFASHTVQ